MKDLGPHLPKSLQTLNLNWNKIGSEGVKYLGPHLPKSLQRLYVYGNNIVSKEKTMLRNLTKEKNFEIFF